MMLPLPHLNFLKLLLLLIGGVIVGGDQTCTDKTDAIKLRKSLFCGYDRAVRPVLRQSDTVNVSMTLWVIHFHFEEHSNVLYLNCWSMYRWTNALLTWDPKAYNNIKFLRAESDDMWVPDVSVYTMGEIGGSYHRIPSTSCIISNTGFVRCSPPTSIAAHCASDLRRWPFDVQQCTLNMGSWTHSGNELNLTFGKQSVITSGAAKNREWDLLETKAEFKVVRSPQDTFPYFEITLKLRRHSGAYAATVVIPAFVLAILTLLMFFLDPLTTERLTLGCMDVLAHCLYLSYLGAILPTNGDYTPLIVAFFRDSFLLVGMSLLVAVILRGMLTAERAPPDWLSTAVEWILDSTPGQWIILNQFTSPKVTTPASNEDGSALVDATPNSPKKNQWHSVVILLDRVCLIVFTLTLFILFMAFVP